MRRFWGRIIPLAFLGTAASSIYLWSIPGEPNGQQASFGLALSVVPLLFLIRERGQ